MTRRTLLTLVLGSVSVAAVVVHGRNDRVPTGKLRVLFIGNGIVDRHDLPDMVRRLGASDDPTVAMEVDRLTERGATLRRHLNRGKAGRMIAEGGYDFVVLQEQSMVARTPAGIKALAEDVEVFNQLIHAAGSQPVLMTTWAPADKPRLEESIAAVYAQVSRETGVRLAPTGRAVADAKTLADVNTNPRFADGPAGAYLAVCVLYETITGHDCRGLSSLGLIDVPPRTAARLQRIAHEVVLDSDGNHR